MTFSRSVLVTLFTIAISTCEQDNRDVKPMEVSVDWLPPSQGARASLPCFSQDTWTESIALASVATSKNRPQASKSASTGLKSAARKRASVTPDPSAHAERALACPLGRKCRYHVRMRPYTALSDETRKQRCCLTFNHSVVPCISHCESPHQLSRQNLCDFNGRTEQRPAHVEFDLEVCDFKVILKLV